MKKNKTLRLLCTLGAAMICHLAGASVNIPAEALRVNNIGYLPDDVKAVVYLGHTPAEQLRVTIRSATGGQFAPDSIITAPAWEPLPAAARIYLSSLTTPGEYDIELEDTLTGATLVKNHIYIGRDAYIRRDLHQLPLTYIRQQRCGFNPVHGDSCHRHDGIAVLAGQNTGHHFDVTGGWHDASDYLQYLPTSANTVYQLLFAYQEQPRIWSDIKNTSGLDGANGVADILDEARHGLEWMLKMNASDTLYFNQIADDRDHRFVGVPSADSVDYDFGPGKARPVYPTSGVPYGLKKYKNRSRGEASSVAKYASAFALGAEIFADKDASFADTLAHRAVKAYEYARSHPGACQTAPCISPYFYEEDNYVDDLELAAAQLYDLTGEKRYLEDAVSYGRMEPVTPWMGADSARHYQWYPFINLGHYRLARNDDSRIKREFAENMRTGLDRVARKGRDNAFLCGLPFIWCSNNLAAAFVTQAMLYREITGDTTYREAETAMRDWLLGANPWGQTMIILPEEFGLPSPRDAHSAMTNLTLSSRPGRDWLVGGLVDGPVYTSIFNALWGVHLRNEDRFKPFQGPRTVYHDDYSDYSTNEPTLDGTASLSWFLGRLSSPIDK